MAGIANGGILTMQDLANYQVRWHEPVKCGYRGYTIVSAPPPSSGGATICQILNIAAPYPLDQWGYGDERSVPVLAEAERRAFADSQPYLGDPAFVSNPLESLLSAAQPHRPRRTIKPAKPTPT